jgi:TPR repeat protein
MKKIVLVLMALSVMSFGGDFEEAAKEAKAKNYTKAIKLYESAMNDGNPKAPFYLGMFYFMGMGVDKDAEKAISLWHKSAEHGYVEAQITLGLMYGDQFKDYSKAV